MNRKRYDKNKSQQSKEELGGKITTDKFDGKTEIIDDDEEEQHENNGIIKCSLRSAYIKKPVTLFFNRPLLERIVPEKYIAIAEKYIRNQSYELPLLPPKSKNKQGVKYCKMGLRFKLLGSEGKGDPRILATRTEEGEYVTTSYDPKHR